MIFDQIQFRLMDSRGTLESLNINYPECETFWEDFFLHVDAVRCDSRPECSQYDLEEILSETNENPETCFQQIYEIVMWDLTL